MSEKCPFKSAKELGLTQEQWDALVKTQVMLERGMLQHISGDDIDRGNDAWRFYKKNKKRGDLAVFNAVFNMAVWDERVLLNGNCGTACCIGGSAEFIAGKKVFAEAEDNYPRALYELFCPHGLGKNWNNLTPQQAAKALGHYLTTGDNGIQCWNLALGIEA